MKSYILCSIYIDPESLLCGLENIRYCYKIEGFYGSVEACRKMIDYIGEKDYSLRKGFYIAEIVEEELDFCM